MTGVLVAAASPSPLWYLTRGTGMVALVLLTMSVVLGVLHSSRWERPAWPRFATGALHRNVSLLVVILLGIHIVTAELDTFAPVGWPAVLIPFASSYRPIWLGLGTLAFDLLLAVVITSVLRGRIGHRVWRIVHWLAYVSWPVALVHALGTGTDARLGWAQFGVVLCVLAVAAAVGWRILHATPGRRGIAGVAALLAALLVGIWAGNGPLRSGWARRAGTPPRLLATAGAAPARAPVGTASHSAAPSGFPAVPFSAQLSGTLTQNGPNGQGVVTINIATTLSNGASGDLRILLQGQASGGGVSLASSSVKLGPANDPGRYTGTVLALDGDQLVASVQSGSSSPLQLGVSLQINPTAGSVRGTVQVTPGNTSSGTGTPSGEGEGDGG